MSTHQYLSARLPALSVAVAASLLLVACGRHAPDQASVGAPAESSASVVSPATVAGDRSVGRPALGRAGDTVPPALRFDVPAVAGGRVTGASLLGHAAVVWFWTPWCSVCRAEAPDVAAAAAKYTGRVSFLGVGAQGSVASMREFVTEAGVGGFGHAVDADGAVWAGFGVIGQPSFAFVRPDGRMTVVPGGLTPEELGARIGRLLAS